MYTPIFFQSESMKVTIPMYDLLFSAIDKPESIDKCLNFLEFFKCPMNCKYTDPVSGCNKCTCGGEFQLPKKIR